VVAVPQAPAEHPRGGFIGSAEAPSDEAGARRYTRDRENVCACRQRWSSIRRRAIDWARRAAATSPSAAAMIDPFIRMCHE
jgi:hypothetical protein